MKIQFIGIVLITATVGWLGYTGISMIFKKPACTPREGEAYCIAHTTTQTITAGEPQPYSFSIVDAKGNHVTQFTPIHTKIMHMIVVRHDLGDFQHLHPTFNEKTGIFSVPDLTLPTDGTYRAFVDFMEKDASQAMTYEDIATTNPNAYTAKDTIKPKQESAADGYNVRLTTSKPLQSSAMTTLTFTITKNGIPVTNLEPYLGAYAHTVIIRNGTLEYLHTHPETEGHAHSAYSFIPTAHAHGAHEAQTGKIAIMTTFPFGGDYKLFFQVQHEGVVRIFDFVVHVAQGEAGDHGEMMHH